MVKNMNNKGFAISTIIYGLLLLSSAVLFLLLGTVSFSRSSDRNFIGKIEEELNELAGSTIIPEYQYHNPNMLVVYQYDYINIETFCVTGEEKSCVLLKTEADSIYNRGTIIKYRVNSNESYYFHVLHDDGDTLTLQQRENILTGQWYLEPDNTKGPLTAISALESETSDWINVNDQTYTMGSTVFGNGINAMTGCSPYSSCTKNTYAWETRTAKARMITLQEAAEQGCSSVELDCPIYMSNYLSNSTEYGGTVNRGTTNRYWTMNAHSSSSYPSNAWYVLSNRRVVSYPSNNTYGIRAVIVINK